MSEISAQTVRLSRGRHARPEDGACVVELASMLAEEPFTDHPSCVSPVIAAFLRGYNDGIGDERRRDLYPVAADIVDSVAEPAVEAARKQRCRDWIAPLHRTRWTWRWATRLGDTAWLERAGLRAAGAAERDASGAAHAAALRLVRELIGTPPVAFPRRGREAVRAP
jgi:hypothetical protein